MPTINESNFWFNRIQKYILISYFIVNIMLMIFSVPDAAYLMAADMAVSMEPARSLISGNGFTHTNGEPFTWGTPLYPIFLAFFLGLFPWKLALCVIIFMQCSLLYLIGLMTRNIAESFSQKAAVLAQVLLIFNPNILISADLLQTEILFTFFLTASTVMIFRYRDTLKWNFAMMVGVFIGLATMVRPVGQFVIILLPLIFILFLPNLSRNELIRYFLAGMLAVISALLIISPWIARNHSIFGKTFLTANTGMYLEAQYRQLLHNGKGLSDADTATLANDKLASHLLSINIKISELEKLSKIEQSQVLSSCYLEAILDEKFSTHAKAIELSMTELFISGGASNLRNYLGIEGKTHIVEFQSRSISSWMDSVFIFFAQVNFGYSALLIITFSYCIAMRILCIVGLFKIFDETSTQSMVAILLLIITLSMSYLYLGQSRFRVPLEPYLAVIAAIGLESLRIRLGKK